MLVSRLVLVHKAQGVQFSEKLGEDSQRSDLLNPIPPFLKPPSTPCFWLLLHFLGASSLFSGTNDLYASPVGVLLLPESELAL